MIPIVAAIMHGPSIRSSELLDEGCPLEIGAQDDVGVEREEGTLLEILAK
jgi:hypothetical protein